MAVGEAPFRLLRFCEMSFREMVYARRKDDGKAWDVIYTYVGKPDQGAAESFSTLHMSFRDWRQYFTENDGRQSAAIFRRSRKRTRFSPFRGA